MEWSEIKKAGLPKEDGRYLVVNEPQKDAYTLAVWSPEHNLLVENVTLRILSWNFATHWMKIIMP